MRTEATQSQPSSDVRVLLIERPGCHLCVAAHGVLDAVSQRTGFAWTRVDVNSSEQLQEAYGELVPVVLVDGVVAGYWRLDGARIEDLLARGDRLLM